jgi:hypothetical protein
MGALIVPLSLIRLAVQQSHAMGCEETKQQVIDRLLNDLRTFDHPAARAVREGFARRSDAPHAPRG